MWHSHGDGGAALLSPNVMLFTEPTKGMIAQKWRDGKILSCVNTFSESLSTLCLKILCCWRGADDLMYFLLGMVSLTCGLGQSMHCSMATCQAHHFQVQRRFRKCTQDNILPSLHFCVIILLVGCDYQSWRLRYGIAKGRRISFVSELLRAGWTIQAETFRDYLGHMGERLGERSSWKREK